MNSSPLSIALIWAQYGPYHFARAAALRRLAAPVPVHALELAARSRDYGWQRSDVAVKPVTVCDNGRAEELPFANVFRQVRRKLMELDVKVCCLPSYFPKQSLAALLAAKSLGLRTVMMNESHAGTARAKGVAGILKRMLVRLFDAALVGGEPHRRYFAALGIPDARIFTGYDAVDNDFFGRRAEEIRCQRSKVRDRYGLPEHYFLSVGRFVAKKNLGTLIRAYRRFVDLSSSKHTHLVMVGSGEEEPKLRALCSELGLPICDHLPSRPPSSELCPPTPTIHFYGFRQIDENPIFYALADAFVLPSLWEEWGLVVNEAMASGLPVVVSAGAGCAEDLLAEGWPVLPQSMQGGPREFIERLRLRDRIRQNGFVFDPRSSEELSRILVALDRLGEVRAAMGEYSQQIVERFSCENFAVNALRAARSALGRKPA